MSQAWKVDFPTPPYPAERTTSPTGIRPCRDSGSHTHLIGSGSISDAGVRTSLRPSLLIGFASAVRRGSHLGVEEPGASS